MSEFRIDDRNGMRRAFDGAWSAVRNALSGGPVCIEVKRPSKTRDQEKKYHAMIRDIARSATFGGRQFSVEEAKAVLVDAFEAEMQANGTPIRRPSRVIPSLDGRRVVTIRPSTRDFLKSEAGDFVEFLYSVGVEYGARFSEPSLKAYEDYINGRN